MEQPDPDDRRSSALRSPFHYHSSSDPSQLPISLANASAIDTGLLDDDPDAFYRPFSARTNLPDIFLDQEVQESMAPKKKPTRINGTTTKPASSSATTLPRATYRSVSNPASAIPTPASKPSPIPTRPGLIKERVKQFDQPSSSSSPRNTPASSSSSKPHSSRNRDHPTRNGASTNPTRLKKRTGQSRQPPPLFGEVLSPEAGAGYGIPTLNKQRSNLETNLPKLLSPPSSRNGLSPLHGRSKSDETDIDMSPAETTSLAPSRIPVRRARRASDLGPSVSSVRSPAASDRSSGSNQTSHGPPTSPAKLTSRRYSPNRHVETNQSLTAVIKEPPPKLSPTLRSSRPRKPVSAATTAASRARVSERYGRPTSAEKQMPRGPPKDYVRVDVAQRRDQVHHNLSKTYYDRPRAKESKSPEPSSPIHVTAPSSPENTTAGAERKEINLIIEDQAVKPVSEDASPINGVSPVTPATMRAKESLLRQVLFLRDNESAVSAPTPQVPEDLLSELNDGETVQFFLGQTPVLPSENFFAPPPPPIPEAEEEFDFPGGRSSIYPDDSVSVIYTRKQTHSQQFERPPQIPPKLDTEQAMSYTIDSAARSQINRVLEQYQRGNAVQEQPTVVNEQVDELTPNMAQHCDWDSIEDTRHYSGSVTDNETYKMPVRTQTPTSTNSRSNSRPHSIAEELMDDEGYRGTAIIYTNGRPNPLSPDTSKSDSTATPSKSWHTPMESFVSPTSNNNSRTNSIGLPFTSSPRASKDGLGLTLDPQSPEMPISPRPGTGSDSASGATASTKPEPHRIDTQTSLRQGSWGLPSSPAPKNRPRRETIEIKDGDSSRRESRTSKRSLAAISRAYSTSSDQTGEQNNQASPNDTGDTDPAALKAEKKLKERWNFLKELIDTEHSYFHDMTIGVDIFLATAPAVTSLTYEDRRLIFGNIEKIRDLAAKVLEALKKSVQTVYRVPPENRFHIKRGSAETARESNGLATGYKPEREAHAAMDLETTVGATFCELGPEMDRLFKQWMIHSEKSNRRIQQVKEDGQVKMWLEECYENAKDITNAWDLDSLLVKPTQRYMKYPLLLTGILSCTPPEHPDYDHLVRSLKLIEDSVAGINEEKRRREVASELLAQKSKKEFNSRLNLRNFAVFGRQKGQKPRAASQSAQSQPLPADDDSYEVVRQKFGGHFFQLQIVMRDFEKYLEDMRYSLAKLTGYAQSLEASYRFDVLSRFPEQESRVHQYLEVVTSIQRHMLPEHIKAVEKYVITPVRKLWHLHDNPQVLMLKHRKLKPQYQKYIKEKDKDKANEKVKTEAEQWIALNQLLKDELPQLYALTGEIVQACLQNFLEIQCRWEDMWMTKLKPFIEDGDMDLFLECNFGEFLMLTQDEFFRDFDNIELDVGAMATTSGNLAAAIAAAEKGSELRWFRDDPNEPERVIEAAKRPSTASKESSLNPSTHSARGSVEQANRSTPNLNMTITSPTPSSMPHRRSYNNALSPLPTGNAFANIEGDYAAYLASAPVSGGPGTPNSAAQPTPGLQPANRQWFDSDWANQTSPEPITLPASMHNTADREHWNRGIDGITLSHNAHASERLAQQYPQVSYYDQIMASQHYHSRHHSNSAPLSGHLLSPDPTGGNGNGSGSALPSPRYSGIFHSALPADMADDDAELLPRADGSGDVRVLFIVASLFEFHIDSNRREAGYPYLKYVAGEIFEIVGQRGELWLARNQDDSEGTLGWIWEKHFALLPMEPQ